MVDLDSNPTKLIEIVEIGKQLLITRGSLTTFSIANDIAKYFAIIPAMFAGVFAGLDRLNIMRLDSPESAILSAVIFNALIIIGLIPLALRGVRYTPVLGRRRCCAATSPSTASAASSPRSSASSSSTCWSPRSPASAEKADTPWPTRLAQRASASYVGRAPDAARADRARRPRLPARDDRARPGRVPRPRRRVPGRTSDGKVVGSDLIGQASPAGLRTASRGTPTATRVDPTRVLPEPALRGRRRATTRWPPRRPTSARRTRT